MGKRVVGVRREGFEELAGDAPGPVRRPGQVGRLAVADFGGGGDGLDGAGVEQVLAVGETYEWPLANLDGDRIGKRHGGRGAWTRQRNTTEAVAVPQAEEALLGGGGEAPEDLGERLGVGEVEPAFVRPLATPGCRPGRPFRRQGDRVELGIGTQRHATPGGNLPPAQQTMPMTRLLGGVQDSGVGLESRRHDRGHRQWRAELLRCQALTNPISPPDIPTPRRLGGSCFHSRIIAPPLRRPLASDWAATESVLGLPKTTRCSSGFREHSAPEDSFGADVWSATVVVLSRRSAPERVRSAAPTALPV